MLVVAGCYDGSVHGWQCGEVESSTESKCGDLDLAFAYRAHQSCLKCLAIGLRGGKEGSEKKWLASGGTDEIVRVYDLGKLEEVGELIEHTDTVLSLAFIGNKFLLSGGKDGKLCLWRCRDWNCVATLKGHKPGPVNSIAVHPSGKIALTTSDDNSLRMWNLETARPASRNRLQGFARLDMVAWFPNSRGYAVVADSKYVLLFDISNSDGKPQQKLEFKSRVNAICFAPPDQKQGPKLAVGLDNGSLVHYDVEPSGQANIDSATTLDCGARIRGLQPFRSAECKNGLVSACSSGEILLWDLASNSQVRNALRAGSDTHVTCMVNACALGEFNQKEKAVASQNLQGGNKHGGKNKRKSTEKESKKTGSHKKAKKQKVKK